MPSAPPPAAAVPALPPPVPGEPFAFRSLESFGGRPLAGWTAGPAEQGAAATAPPRVPPLVLVHSVNAAASAAEIRPLFERWAARRRVFAFDLPGFGSSPRPDIRYSPRVMTDALHALAAAVRERCGPGPIDALAISTGCEFLARAAAERPAEWGRLALVSPTGLAGRFAKRGAPGASRELPGLRRVLGARWWSGALFGALTKPKTVRYFLERTWGGPAVDATMADYAVLTARQPGAQHAPIAFLSAALFSADILAVYERLPQPVWASHGTRGDFTDYRWKTALAGWRWTVYEAGALPYFEHPETFDRALADFLDGPSAATATAASSPS